MEGVFQFLQAQPFFTIFGVVALGMMLGRQSIGGLSLGSVVCIILAGLAVSMWASAGSGISLELPNVLKTIFFNLFIFSMGLKIGPQFFAGLQRDGWHMVTIGLIVALLAPALSLLCGWIFDLPQGAIIVRMVKDAKGPGFSGAWGEVEQTVPFTAVRDGGTNDN